MWKRLLRFGFRLLYNELAWTYDLVAWSVSLGKWKAWGRTSIRRLRGRRVLELAHGPGHLLIALKQAGYQPIGVDLSPTMSRQASRRLRRAGLDVPLVRCRAQALPFRSGCFDAAVAAFPTEYIVDPPALQEAARVTDRDGRLVIVAAANLGGRGPLPRLIERLHKVTGQGEPMPHGNESAFGKSGWSVKTEYEPVGNSSVLLAIGEKSTAMTSPHPLIIDGSSLTLEDVIDVARAMRSVALGDHARSRVAGSRAWVDHVVEHEAPTVYGINTGFGVFANRHIARQDAEQLSRNLILSHAVGVGDPLPEDAVRAAMLIRANTLAIGHSGVRPDIIDTLIAMLNRRVTPIVPEKGSLGASGDLALLSHLALVFTTDATGRDEDSGEAIFEGRRMSGQEAMRRAGIPRVILGAKEGLALNNGATFSAAIGALAVHDAEVLLDNAIVAAAMSFEALRGVSHAFDERLHSVRKQVGQVEIAARMRALIEGSTLIDSTDRVQDAYTLRAIPQVLGPIQETIAFVRGIVERELNAATDNPLIFLDLPSDDKALSGANFHGEPIALAMDFLKIAVSEIAGLSERRLFRLTDEKLNDGLPAMLVEDGGLHSGFMMAQYTAAALVSDNKTLAHPDSVDSIPTSANQEDFNPMAMNAARHCAEIIDNAQHVVALEMLAAAQALDLRLRSQAGARLGRGTQAARDRIRREVSFLDKDRLLAPDVKKAVEMVRSGEVVRAVRI